MIGYTEEMFELEVRVAKAALESDEEQYVYLAKLLTDMGGTPCPVCGTMVHFHHLDGWLHEDLGTDHDARPDRGGFEWPSGLPVPSGHTGG